MVEFEAAIKSAEERKARFQMLTPVGTNGQVLVY